MNRLLISVTSTEPLTSDNAGSIGLRCKSGVPDTNMLLNIAPPMVSRNAYPMEVKPCYFMDHAGDNAVGTNCYYWGGNGSAMSFSYHTAYEATNNGYGREKDEARRLSDRTVSMFQVYSDSN